MGATSLQMTERLSLRLTRDLLTWVQARGGSRFLRELIAHYRAGAFERASEEWEQLASERESLEDERELLNEEEKVLDRRRELLDKERDRLEERREWLEDEWYELEQARTLLEEREEALNRSTVVPLEPETSDLSDKLSNSLSDTNNSDRKGCLTSKNQTSDSREGSL